MSETKRIVGRGRVVRYGDAVGLRLPEGTIWYPDQDIGDYVGEDVQVTIERMGPARTARAIGFRLPEPEQPSETPAAAPAVKPRAGRRRRS